MPMDLPWFAPMDASRSPGSSPKEARKSTPPNSSHCQARRRRAAWLIINFITELLAMPASQHQSPKSDIEISQAAKKRPILDVAKEKLGIAPENLEPYGHYKAKVSMDY